MKAELKMIFEFLLVYPVTITLNKKPLDKSSKLMTNGQLSLGTSA